MPAILNIFVLIFKSSAVFFASSRLPLEEYLDGINIPITFLLPIASTAIAALIAESMPPDNPKTIFLKEFLKK